MRQGRPFIIWTLQRTGGTNLARRLFEACGLLPADRERQEGDSPILDLIPDQWKLHEPFNYGEQPRTFGEITRRWVVDNDSERLAAGIAEIIGLKLPMKHCVEMVPWAVTETLARTAAAGGYAHIFLFRREALGRLLSLHFAKMSGVWGPHFNDASQLDDQIYREPLPVDELVHHESFCAQTLEKVWNLLRSLGAPAMALAYEDIYRDSDAKRVADRLLPVLHYLELSRGDFRDQELIREIVEAGDQGTRDKYGRFADIDVLSEALAGTPRFAPQSEALFTRTAVNHEAVPELSHVSLDLVPSAVYPGQSFDLGGVVVVKGVPSSMQLKLRGNGQEIELAWNVRSPRMARLYPNAANSGAARFKQSGVAMPGAGRLELVLSRSNGEAVTVGSVDFNCITEQGKA